MARRKTETEATKTEKKASKMIPITFKPQFSAATKKTVNLKEPEVVLVGGQTRVEYKSQIPGLPPAFTIHKDEIVEVTEEQFQMLYERGEIDTPEDIAERDRQRTLLSNQIGANPKEYIQARDRVELYQDGFVLADPKSIELTRVRE